MNAICTSCTSVVETFRERTAGFRHLTERSVTVGMLFNTFAMFVFGGGPVLVLWWMCTYIPNPTAAHSIDAIVALVWLIVYPGVMIKLFGRDDDGFP